MRALPSLLVEWRWKGSVDEWRLEGDVIYAVGGDRLSAIDVATGAPLWDYDLELDCSCSRLEVLPTRVAAGIDGRIVLVDRASGALAADLPLGEAITALVPDPLVVGYRDELGVYGLVRLDEASGVELARYEPQGSLSSVERLGDRLIVRVGEGGAAGPTLAGLDLSLTQLWYRQLPARSWSRREGDEIVVELWTGEVAGRWTLDPATGDLLPRADGAATAEATGEAGVEALAGGLVLVLRDDQPPVLMRLSGGAGDPLWQVDLPFVVEASAAWGDRVVLLERSWGARGALLVVDLATGEILARAAGLRGMEELRTSGDLLISETAGGLAAVRLDDFGPPEVASTTLEAAVAAILAELADPESELEPYEVQQELADLGAEALPFLTAAVPTAAPEVVAMIASLASEAEYAPAAAPLAVRAEALLDGRTSGSQDDDGYEGSYLQQIAYALAALAQGQQAESLDRLLALEGELGFARLPLMAALGRLAPERATAQLQRLRARYANAGSWLVEPAVEPWLEAAALEVDRTALEDLWKSFSHEELRQAMLATQTAIAESAAGRWIVFPDDQFPLRGLWTARLGEDGLAEGPVFVGAGGPPESAGDEPPAMPVLEARLSDSVLEVGYSGVTVLSVPLDELRRDGDGDGLTDRLEEFLNLDPAAADSDGDGLLDAEDPAPRGDGGQNSGAEDAAFLALHETLWLVQSAEDGGAEIRSVFLTEVPALEWRGGRGATFILPRDEAVGCRVWTYRTAATPPRPLDADEVAVEFVTGCGMDGAPEPAESFVLKSTPGGWVLSGLAW